MSSGGTPGSTRAAVSSCAWTSRDSKDRRAQARKSSRIRYSAGTRISVTTVANNTPNPSDIAMGTNSVVDMFAVAISGTSPINVVAEVSTMGRNRTTPESSTAR